MKHIRVLDLCSGIGGFRAGCGLLEASNIAFNVVGYAEIDKYPKIGYQAMFDTNHELDLGDIIRLTRSDGESFKGGFLQKKRSRSKRIDEHVPDHDLLFAGFPCQPFSQMGAKLGVDDMLGRGELIFDLVEIIREKQPSFFILENVKKFFTHNGGRLCELIKEELKVLGQGYEVQTWVLNAKNFSVPQVRNRLFIVGCSKKISTKVLDLPQETGCSAYEQGVHHFLEKNVDEKYYLSERIKKTILSEGTGGWKAKAEINKFVARPLTKTMHKMHRASQDNYYSDSFINGVWDKKNQQVIEAKVGHNRIRRITPFEALKIQGFPESLIAKALKSGLSDTRLYMAAGNAVPPPLVAAVLKALPLDQMD
jgi:DNA (cytosine-5)-methyltransferase 1